jgi:hypothetical protein
MSTHQENNGTDRVQRSTPSSLNARIELETKQNLAEYATEKADEIDDRIQELDKEWDIERSLELNAAVLALTGTVLGMLVDKRWFALPIVVASFLTQHAIQGWCPPLPILRKLGFRTRKEIDKEKYALKAMRGDFKYMRGTSVNKAWQAVNE